MSAQGGLAPSAHPRQRPVAKLEGWQWAAIQTASASCSPSSFDFDDVRFLSARPTGIL